MAKCVPHSKHVAYILAHLITAPLKSFEPETVQAAPLSRICISESSQNEEWNPQELSEMGDCVCLARLDHPEKHQPIALAIQPRPECKRLCGTHACH